MFSTNSKNIKILAICRLRRLMRVENIKKTYFLTINYNISRICKNTKIFSHMYLVLISAFEKYYYVFLNH